MERTCLESYIELCRPFHFDEPWQRFGQEDPYSLAGPSDPERALEALASKHSVEDLLASGLAYRNDQEQLEMRPLLAAPMVPVIALTDPHSGKIIDVLTERGCVRSGTYPFFAVVGDQFTRKALERSEHTLILTGNIQNTILLRRLGFPAAPVYGLNELGDTDIARYDELFECKHSETEQLSAIHEAAPLGQSQESATKPNVEPLQRIALMGWTALPPALVTPTPIRQSLEHLLELEDLIFVDLAWVDFWVPSEKSFQDMTSALKQQQIGGFEDLLLKSLANEIQVYGRSPTNTEAPSAPDPAATLVSIHKILLDTSEPAARLQKLKEAKADYQQTYTEKILRPLFESALTMTDPLNRAIQIQFAQLHSLFDEKMFAVRERQIYNDGRAADHRDKSFSELLTVSEQLLRLSKELNQCKTPRRKSAMARSLPLKNFSRFAASASTNNN